ncbi:MAG: hypothetical protein AB7V77_00840 [Candidatus Woesearchaeota archaeon]
MSSIDEIQELKSKLHKEVNIVHNIGSIQTILEKNPKEHISIAIGYRPSGRIHLGNIVSILMSAYISKEIGIHMSSLKVTNCDLELLSVNDSIQNHTQNNKTNYVKPKDIAHYFKYVIQNGETNSMSSINSEPIKILLNDLKREKNISFQEYLLSEIQSEQGFRKKLKRFCERIDEVIKYFPDFRAEILKQTQGGAYIFPICSNCNVGNQHGSNYDNGKLKNKCPSCGKKNEFDIEDTEHEISTNFIIDPIRDLESSASSNIHYFGGDYTELLNNNFTKLEKIAAILNIVKDENEETPILFGGPIIYCKKQMKMGKSINNGLEYNTIREIHGEQYLNKLWTYVQYLVQEDMHHVDFSITKNFLL